jgi:hypothetical protein
MEIVEVLISDHIELDLAVFEDDREAFKLEREANKGVFVLSLGEIIDKLFELVIGLFFRA